MRTPWWVTASWVIPVLTIGANTQVSSFGESLRGAGGVLAQLGSAVPFLWGGVAMSSGVFGVASIVAGLRSRRWSWALQGLVGIGAPCLMVAMAAAVLMMRANRGG